MKEQVIIGKILWCQGEETFYGPFDSMGDWKKWAEECMEEDKDDKEIESICFEIMYRVPKDFEEQK